MKKIKLFKYVLWAIVFLLLLAICVIGIHIFNKQGANPEAWVEYISSFGALSGFVLLLFQVLQIFIPIIPGEIIEIVSGLLFKPFFACIIIYIGIFVATTMIFFMVKTLGKHFSKIFISEEKLRSLRFINTKEKLNKSAFVLFLIPGTPKDLLSYFFAFTPIKYSEFIIITLIARFPSIISSIIGGNFIRNGMYINAIALFLITAIVSICGILFFDKLKKRFYKNKNIRLSSLRKQKSSKIRSLKKKSYIKYKILRGKYFRKILK